MLQTSRRVIRHPNYDVGARPFIIFWETTRACDLACAHCRAEAAPGRHHDELTTREGRELMEEIAGFGPPSPLLVLTGGDPMKRPDLMELISFGASRHLAVALSPSATPLLTVEALSELKGAGLKVLSLSVDAADRAVHDSFRGVDGVFDHTLELWEAARRLGFKIQINTTVTQLNLAQLAGVAHLVRNYGAVTWSVFFLVQTGRGTVLEPISAAQCEDVMHFLYDVGTAIPVKTTEGHHFKRVVAQRTILERRGIPYQEVLPLGETYRALRSALEPWPEGHRGRRSPMDVNVGRGVVFISHVGTVYPGGFLPVAAGNVRVDGLRRIYRESPQFQMLRDPARLAGRCGECEFVTICGGSRSRAFASSGDLFAEDPLCAYVPGSFPLQEDVAALLDHDGAGAAPRAPSWATS